MAKKRLAPTLTNRKARHILKKIFLRNGYVRVKDEDKLKANGSQNYKKGYEIRFVPKDDAELELLQTAIATLGFYVGRTFEKHGHVIQPLYGKTITLEFQELKNNQYY